MQEVVTFNHGYIPPAQHRTTERYVAYVDAFARNGYIVFRSDYRGHGNSEGEAAEGDNHNISVSFGTALERTIRFFDIRVKGNRR